jgi:hypothetical protein
MVVWGTDSDVLSEAQARRMVEVLPRGELVTVPGVGHAPTLVEPVVLTALEHFLRAGGRLTPDRRPPRLLRPLTLRHQWLRGERRRTPEAERL